MDGVGGTLVSRALKGSATGAIVYGTGGFRPNAASNPSSTNNRGTLKGLFTVTYTATGLYTVTFSPTKFKFRTGQFPIIVPVATAKDTTATNRFQVIREGDWDNTNRRFGIRAYQEGTAFQVPSDAANWIDFILYGLT